MPASDNRAVRATRHAAAWRAGSGDIVQGTLEVDASGLRLRGAAHEERIEHGVRYGDIRSVRIGRLPAEMMRGRPTLLVELEDATTVQIEPSGMGLLHEVTDLIAELAAAAASASSAPPSGAVAGRAIDLAVVVVPLRPERRDDAKALLEGGPPFDPGDLDLDEHHVFFGETEAIFLFRGANARLALERASRDPRLWRAGLAWQWVIAGPPRLVESAFSWSRSGSGCDRSQAAQ